MSLPQRIRRRRESLGLSAASAAAQAGIARSAWLYVETGEREPRRPTMIAMARVLGVGLDFFHNDDPESD